MLTKLLAALGDPNDVRSAAATAAAVLVTIFHPGNSAMVTAVVDGVAAVIVAIDQWLAHPARTTVPATVVATKPVPPAS